MGHLKEVPTSRLRLHVVRNIFHFTAQNLWFYALAFIPLAQLFAIEFTTPIWIALLAPLFLGEALTRWRVLAAVLGFVGILVIAQPGYSPLNVGHLTAALSTLGFCGSIMMTKALSRTGVDLLHPVLAGDHAVRLWCNRSRLGRRDDVADAGQPALGASGRCLRADCPCQPDQPRWPLRPHPSSRRWTSHGCPSSR